MKQQEKSDSSIDRLTDELGISREEFLLHTNIDSSQEDKSVESGFAQVADIHEILSAVQP